MLWETANFQDDGAKRAGVCFATNTDLELWTEEVEQHIIDNMIIFQKPFPGAARTELESQLQRAVAKGKHVKCKIDLECCLFWDPGGNRVPRPRSSCACGGPARVADGQAVGVLFEVRHLMLEPLKAPPPAEAPTYRWRSVMWRKSMSRRTRLPKSMWMTCVSSSRGPGSPLR